MFLPLLSHFGLFLMPLTWVRHADGGDWVRLDTVAKVTAHLKSKGINIFHAQVSRVAETRGTQKGWQFTFKDPLSNPLTSPPSTPSTSTHSTTLAVPFFFKPTSALPMCGCCGTKLLEDVSACHLCILKVHALCMLQGRCFQCVCRVCCGHARCVSTVCIARAQSMCHSVLRWSAGHLQL